MSARNLRVIVCTCALLAAGTAAAQSNYTGPWEKGSVSLGGFISTTRSEFQLNSESLGVGTLINLEDGLGIDADYTSFRVDAFYRMGSTRRHQLELHYYQSMRDGSRVTQQDYQIGDTVYPAGTGLKSELDLWFANANYTYAFLSDDRVRLGASIGVHTTGIKFKVNSSGQGSESESVTAPLPVIGARFDVVLAEKWRLKSSLDVFYLEYDNWTGSLVDSGLAVEYLPFKHVGFGLGYNTVRYQVKAENNSGGLGGDWNGQIKYDFAGVLLYVKAFY